MTDSRTRDNISARFRSLQPEEPRSFQMKSCQSWMLLGGCIRRVWGDCCFCNIYASKRRFGNTHPLRKPSRLPLDIFDLSAAKKCPVSIASARLHVFFQNTQDELDAKRRKNICRCFLGIRRSGPLHSQPYSSNKKSAGGGGFPFLCPNRSYLTK